MSGRNLSAVLWSLVGNIANPVSGLILSVLLARLLGAEGRGEVAAATAPVLLLTTIFALGIPESVTFHVAQRRIASGKILELTLACVVIGAIGVGAIFVFGETITEGRDDLFRILFLCSLAIGPTLVVGVLRAIAAANHAWSTIAFERGLGALSRVLLLVAVASFGDLTPGSAALIMVGTPAATGLIYVWWLFRSGRRTALINIAGEAASRANTWSFGLRVWFGSLSGVLLSRLDQAILLPLVGIEQLGLYAVAVSVAEVPAVLSNSLREVFFSRASEGLNVSSIAKVSRMSTLMVLVIVILVAVASPLVVPALFGQEFSSSVPCIWILLIGVLIGNPGTLAGVAVSGNGRPGIRSWGLFFAVIVNILTLFMITGRFGIEGAAIATVLATLIAVTVNLYGLNRIRESWAAFVTPTTGDAKQVLRILLTR